MEQMPCQDAPRQVYEAAWPDMFASLQTAYAELTRAQFELERRTAEADLVGRLFTEICGSNTTPVTPWQLFERAPNGRLAHFDVEITTQAGHLVPISISVGLVRNRRDKIIGMQMVANDITARKQAEAILTRQAEELTRSNTELEQFAYVASHDLQEPLHMMASFAQLLAERYKAGLGPDADEFIDYIVDGAIRRIMVSRRSCLTCHRLVSRGTVSRGENGQ